VTRNVGGPSEVVRGRGHCCGRTRSRWIITYKAEKIGLEAEASNFEAKFRNNGQFYLRRIDTLLLAMMKLDTNFKRKVGARASNAVLASIFFAGIIVGIIVTVLAIMSLPEGSSGKSTVEFV
jgi:hypothetical protein